MLIPPLSCCRHFFWRWPDCQCSRSKEYLAIYRIIFLASLGWWQLQKHPIKLCLVNTVLYGWHFLSKELWAFYAVNFYLSCHQAWSLLVGTQCCAPSSSLCLRMLPAGGQAGIYWLAASPGNTWTVLKDALARTYQQQPATIHTKLTSLWVPRVLWGEKVERYMESTGWINESTIQWETRRKCDQE